MSKKAAFLAVAAVALIGGAGLILFKRNQEPERATQAKLGEVVFPGFRYNDVALIHLRGATDVNVIHTNGTWEVQEKHFYPANFHQISDLLIKVGQLKVVEAEPVAPEDLGRVNLDEPGKGPTSGTLIEFEDAQGKVIESMLVGKKHLRPKTEGSPLGNHGNYDGCYILLPKDTKTALLISDDLPAANADPEVWISRDFIKAEHLSTVTLAAGGQEQWTLARTNETSPWELVGIQAGEALDTNRVNGVINAIKYARFDGVEPISEGASAEVARGITATAKTFDGFTYTFKFSPKSPQDMRLMTMAVSGDFEGKEEAKVKQEKLANEQKLEPWIYIVDSAYETLMRKRSELLAGRN